MRRPRRLARECPVAAVLALTAFALLLRLVALGERTMHWDEARVAYWTLRHVRGAGFVYRPVIHGPFVPLVVAPVFDLLGPSAFAARLPIALIGGAAPLAALLFRRVEPSDPAGSGRMGAGLTNAETVALAALLAVVPGFVYYSRFMRSDVPLAVFFLVAAGFAVRALTTGRRRHVVAAGLFLGLAVTTKENALLYLVCAVGAAGVAGTWPAIAAVTGRTDRAARDALAAAAATSRTWIRRHRIGLPLAILAMFVPVVVFFAPRAPANGPTLGATLAGEVPWPALLERATLGTWETFRTSFWVGETRGPYGYYTAKLAGLLLAGALPAVVGAGVAVADELRSPERPLVVPFVAWGVAAMLGYPLATDIPAPWIALHIALPLVVPAAVGWVALAERGVLQPRRWLSLAWWRQLASYRGYILAALVVLSALHVPVVIGVSAVTPPLYVNVLAQSAQPADDLDPLAATVDDAADDGGVLYYGDTYYLPNESIADRPPTADEVWLGWWLRRLPMAWYVERAGAPTGYVQDPDALRDRESIPPVVFVAPAETAEVAPQLADRGYERTGYDLGLYHDQGLVVFVDAAELDGGRRGA